MKLDLIAVGLLDKVVLTLDPRELSEDQLALLDVGHVPLHLFCVVIVGLAS